MPVVTDAVTGEVVVAFYDGSSGRNRFLQSHSGHFGGDAAHSMEPDRSLDVHYQASAVYRATVTADEEARQRCPLACWYAAGNAVVEALTGTQVTLRWSLGATVWDAVSSPLGQCITVGGGTSRHILTPKLTTRKRAVFVDTGTDPGRRWIPGTSVSFTLRPRPPDTVLDGSCVRIRDPFPMAAVMEFQGPSALRWRLPRPGRDLVHLGGTVFGDILDPPEIACGHIYAVAEAVELPTTAAPVCVDVATPDHVLCVRDTGSDSKPAVTAWFVAYATPRYIVKATVPPCPTRAAAGAAAVGAYLLVPENDCTGNKAIMPVSPLPVLDCVFVVDGWLPSWDADAADVGTFAVVFSPPEAPDDPPLWRLVRRTSNGETITETPPPMSVLIVARTSNRAWLCATDKGPWCQYRVVGRQQCSVRTDDSALTIANVNPAEADAVDRAIVVVAADDTLAPPPPCAAPTLYSRSAVLPDGERVFRVVLSKPFAAHHRTSSSSSSSPQPPPRVGFAEFWTQFRTVSAFQNGVRSASCCNPSSAYPLRPARRGSVTLTEILLPRCAPIRGLARPVTALAYLWVHVRHRAIRPTLDGTSTITVQPGGDAVDEPRRPPPWVFHRETLRFMVSIPYARTLGDCRFISGNGAAAVPVEVTEAPTATQPEVLILLPSGEVLDFSMYGGADDHPSAIVVPDESVGIHTHLTLRYDGRTCPSLDR